MRNLKIPLHRIKTEQQICDAQYIVLHVNEHKRQVRVAQGCVARPIPTSFQQSHPWGWTRNVKRIIHGIKKGAAKLRWVGGGGHRPVLCVNETRKADAFSARARSAAKTHLFHQSPQWGQLTCILVGYYVSMYAWTCKWVAGEDKPRKILPIFSL